MLFFQSTPSVLAKDGKNGGDSLNKNSLTSSIFQVHLISRYVFTFKKQSFRYVWIVAAVFVTFVLFIIFICCRFVIIRTGLSREFVYLLFCFI